MIVDVRKAKNLFHYNWEDSNFYFKGFNQQLLHIPGVNCYGIIFS